MSTFNPVPAPSVEADSFADDLVRRFEPWLTADLEMYLRALASMWDEVVLYVLDQEDEAGEVHEGWTILFDPDRCPPGALPHLAQYRGEVLPPGLDEIGQREWIKDAPNQDRGTPRSVFEAAQRRLTGSRLVSMLERPDGVVDKVRIVTYTSQTPEPVGTKADIVSVLPADVVLEHLVQPGVIWDSVETQTWTQRKVKSWADTMSGLTGYEQFPRPKPIS